MSDNNRNGTVKALRDDPDQAIRLFDQDYLYLPQLAEELGITAKILRGYVAMDAETGRPDPLVSLFPNAYKETPTLTGKIRVPLQDVQNYKLAVMHGVPSKEALVEKIHELNNNKANED